MIDIPATRAKLKAAGYTIPGWARAHGLDPSKLPTRFHGKAKFTDEELVALKQAGLLVEV